MTHERTLNDLAPTELKEIIDYIADAYNNRSCTRPEMVGKLRTVYNLSPTAANTIQQAVTQARIRPW